METENRIALFSKLGELFQYFGKTQSWPGHAIGVTEEEFNRFDEIIKLARLRNGWYTEENVRKSLLSLAPLLEKEVLENWLRKYDINNQSKNVAIIQAGNIPFVGFHDMLSVLLAGHQAIIKPSSDDAMLTAELLHLMAALDERTSELVQIEENQIKSYDAVIATGSNNSARYFEEYFSHVPHIIRKSRTSVAVLTGEESEKELSALADDIFDYFGLGCRNVSKLYIPHDYDLDLIFKAIYPKNDIINHNKYANNYDYHKAIFLMNKEELIENGFILFKEDQSLFSPLGTMFYEKYNEENEVEQKLNELKDEIQAIVGKGYVPFGQAQKPQIDDYADNVDTMKFLTELK